MKVATLLEFCQARLKEPSSVRGLIWLATGLGLFGKGAVSDISAAEALVALGSIAAGLVGIFSNDTRQTVVNAQTVTSAAVVQNAEIVLDAVNTTQHFDMDNKQKP